ncbi:MAG: hypothetical protein ACFCUJ_08465 [Thiotrichales bacterium]
MSWLVWAIILLAGLVSTLSGFTILGIIILVIGQATYLAYRKFRTPRLNP